MVSTVLGREGLPYLVSRNGKPTVAVWREIAIHPSEALFLITSVEQIAQTGMKHTGLSTGTQGQELARYSGPRKDNGTSPTPPPPFPSLHVHPATLGMGVGAGRLSEWMLISRLCRYNAHHSAPN